MNSEDEEEGFQGSYIAQEILSLPARRVLRYDKVRDPLSLRMNMVGALKTWQDVAGLLGYSEEKILGLFAHRDRPGLSLLKDWMYEKNGSLEKLVFVLAELKMYSCLEVVYECVAEYEETSGVRTNNPIEGDEDSDSTRPPSSLTSESSVSSENHSVSVATNYSTEQETSIPSNPSLPVSVPQSVATCAGGKICSIEAEDCSSGDQAQCSRVLDDKCRSAGSLENPSTVEKPEFLRLGSWSPPGSACSQSVDSNRSGFCRSMSQPASTEKKKKSSIKKILHRISRKGKRGKKSPVKPGQQPHSCTSVNTEGSSTGTSSAAECNSFTATYTYNEPAEKPCKNFSPLKLNTEEARRSSLTDSLSSGESVSQPTSPGYESGYNSSEGPSVSSGTSISIVHCSDLEGESFEGKIDELYNYFSKTLGYMCYLDKLEMLEIAKNKFRYVERRVKHSDFLFICVSPKLKSIFDSSVDEISDQLEDDEKCMLRLTSDFILSDLANNAGNKKGKFITIILEGSSKKDVPGFLESFMKFSWPKDERKIRCIIEGQPEITPAPVSDVRTDPPSQVIRPAEIL